MEMIKMIGKAARNNYLVAFFNALKKVDTKLELSIEDFVKYAIPIVFNEDTVSAWENWLNLKEVKNWTLNNRIQRIIYTINSNISCTPNFLKEQAKIFNNGEINIKEDFPNYHFIIDFLGKNTLAINTDSFNEMIKVNKPAHLTFSSKFRYEMPTKFNINNTAVYKVNREILNEFNTKRINYDLKARSAIVYIMKKELK